VWPHLQTDFKELSGISKGGFYSERADAFVSYRSFKILAQENNLVRLFGEMTNASTLSE